MRELPSFQTSLVPRGDYVAEVMGEIQEKPSSFDPSHLKTYLEMKFSLKSPLGEYFEFIWTFTHKSALGKI